MKYGKVWCAALALVVVASAAPARASEIGFGGYYAPGAPVTEEFVLGPTVPGKWGPGGFGTGATVTWSLMATGTSCASEAVGCSITSFGDAAGMPAGFLAAIQAAFDAWEAVANIDFTMVADSGVGCAFNAAGCAGDIRIGLHAFDGPGGTLAHGFFPPVNGTTAAGDIHFDLAELWKIGFGGAGFDIFQVMAHEIGHAIGLGHTGVPGSLMEPFYTEAFAGPQADDIAGAVFIYGLPQTPGPDPIPEPATLLLLGSGLFAAAARRRAVKK